MLQYQQKIKLKKLVILNSFKSNQSRENWAFIKIKSVKETKTVTLINKYKKSSSTTLKSVDNGGFHNSLQLLKASKTKQNKNELNLTTVLK